MNAHSIPTLYGTALGCTVCRKQVMVRALSTSPLPRTVGARSLWAVDGLQVYRRG
jgi:hypothetical protein